MNVNSKKLLILCILLSTFTVKAFSTGVGLFFGYNEPNIYTLNTEENEPYRHKIITVNGSLKCTFTRSVFGFGSVIGDFENQFYVGFNCYYDYWLFDHQLLNTWNLFGGIGSSCNIIYSPDAFNYGFGPRFFIGTNVYFIDGAFEFFTQFNISPQYRIDSNKKEIFLAQFPIETGIRFHF